MYTHILFPYNNDIYIFYRKQRKKKSKENHGKKENGKFQHVLRYTTEGCTLHTFCVIITFSVCAGKNFNIMLVLRTVIYHRMMKDLH